METILISIVLILSGIGVVAMAGIHFWPERVKGWIDSYHRLIGFDPFK